MSLTFQFGATRLLLRRWLKFSTVGGIGIFVQLGVLAVLKSLLGVNYLVATALAVEMAVLHNFIWHERWTWTERTRGNRHFRPLTARLIRFNLTTGLISILSNLVLMRLLAGQLHIQYLVANMLTIAICSLGNFLLSEFFVFRTSENR